MILFCFAHAGGGASAYRTWVDDLAPELDVYTAQLPGREHRIREPRLTRMADAVDLLVPVLERKLDRPFAIYGHSLGASLGYEVALRLQARGHHPSLLVVSGRRAPQRPEPSPLLHQLSDVQLVETLRRLGGTPETILREPEMLELLLPMIRDDLMMLETNPRHSALVRCDILALRGAEDLLTTEPDVKAWREVTSGELSYHELPGGHFLAPHVVARVQRLLRHRLRRER